MNPSSVWTPPRSALSHNFAGLLDRLADATGTLDLAPAEALAFLAAAGTGVLLLLDEPDRSPESWDLAVIFPDLLRAIGAPLRSALLRPGLGAAVQERYAVRRLPALLFVRDGGYLGAIEGLRDWSDFVVECRALLAAAPTRPPGIGVAVRAADSSTCKPEPA